MVEVSQGEVRCADLPSPAGSGPGFRRPVIIVQGDHLNRSRIATIVCVPLTSNLAWGKRARERAPSGESGLDFRRTPSQTHPQPDETSLANHRFPGSTSRATMSSAERASRGSLVFAEMISVSTPRLANAFAFRTTSAGSVPSA